MPLADYHRAKTGALFAARDDGGRSGRGRRRRARGARSASGSARPIQVADDMRDVVGDADELGKPVGRDAALGRPSAVRELGLAGADPAARAPGRRGDRLDPACPGAAELRALILAEAAAVPAQGARAPRGLRRRGRADRPLASRPRRLPLWRDRWLAVARPAARQPALPALGRGVPADRGRSRDARARALFDLCAGFVYSQILLACVRLAPVRHPARGAADARRAGAAARAARRTPRRGCSTPRSSLRLVARRGGGPLSGSGELGAALVGNPGDRGDDRASRAALRRSRAIRWRCCAARAATPSWRATGPMPVPTGRPRWPRSSVAALHRADVGVAAAGRAARCSTPIRSRGIAACSTSAAATGRSSPPPRRARPALRLMLFDLPAVAERAQRALRRGRAGATARSASAAISSPIRCRPGADVVSLVRVLHDHDDAGALAILRAVRRALPPGRHAARRRADGGHAGRRADRGRLFRLLPAGHGPRPAAHAGASSRDCCARPGFAEIRLLATADAAADRPDRARPLTARDC